MVLRQNQSRKFHAISLTLSIIFVGIAIFIYSFLYKNNIENITFKTIVYMIVCIEVIMFGIVLCLINFENSLLRKILLFIIGFLVAGVLFNEQFRFGIILFVVTMFVYAVTMRFKNVFSTIVTLTVCVMLFLIFTLILSELNSESNVTLLLYTMFSLLVVFYRLFGVKLNQWFIAKMLGFEEESKTYDVEQLKNQILLIYMIIFVALNVFKYIGKIDSENWNLINNSFLTGLAIIQIDWNKVIFYFKKTSF